MDKEALALIVGLASLAVGLVGVAENKRLALRQAG